MEVKLIKEALDKQEHEEFELALQHKTMLRFFRELEREGGNEEYLKYLNQASARLFLKFHSGAHGFF